MPSSPDDLKPFVARVMVVLALVALALFLWRVIDVLLLIFGASLVAILLRSIADPIARRTPLSQAVALGFAVVLVLGILAGSVLLFGNEVRVQVAELVKRLPQSWAAVEARLAAHPLGEMVLGGMKEKGPNVGAIAEGLTKATAAAVGTLLQLVLVLFGGLYLAGDPQVYRTGLLKLLPEDARDRVANVIDSTGRALRLWLLSQLVTMFVVGVMTGVGLWIIGVPAPFALGLLAGLAEFIPYVGPVLAAVPGLMIALSMDMTTVFYTVLLYILVQQIENNAIQPLIAKEVLSLPPALAIFSVVGLGVVLGPLGLVFAAPLTVLIVVAIGNLYVRETLGETAKLPGEVRSAGPR